MSHCKACKMEIDQKATVCPHCQSYQKQWYKNPQNYGLLFWVLFIAFIFFWHKTMFKSEDFKEYQSYFTVKEISKIVSDDQKKHIITYKINNRTKYKWEDIRYEMIGADENGKLILTDMGSEYRWIVQPKEESYLTVHVEKNKRVKSWSIKIMDLETSKFF